MAAEWFYAVSGVQRGPVSFEELQDRAKKGELGPADLVWMPGLAEWMAASSQPGLFGVAPPLAAAAQKRERDPYPPVDPYETAPYPAPRPARSGGGLRLLLFGSAAVLVLGVVCCGVISVFVYSSKQSNVRSWSLKSGAHADWAIPFQKGDLVQITVTSDRDSDVDLFVFTSRANMNALLSSKNYEAVAPKLCVAFDNDPSKDCHVEFTAEATQDYFVLVTNRKSLDQPQRNRANSGNLVFHPAPK
jgi:hypothetical protein